MYFDAMVLLVTPLHSTATVECNGVTSSTHSRGNGSFRSYSRSDPGSFRSCSLSVRSFRPGSFRPDFRGGSFRPNFGESFRPTLFYIVLLCVKSFSG